MLLKRENSNCIKKSRRKKKLRGVRINKECYIRKIFKFNFKKEKPSKCKAKGREKNENETKLELIKNLKKQLFFMKRRRFHKRKGCQGGKNQTNKIKSWPPKDCLSNKTKIAGGKKK